MLSHGSRLSKEESRCIKEESRCIKEALHLPVPCPHRVMASTRHAARLERVMAWKQACPPTSHGLDRVTASASKESCRPTSHGRQRVMAVNESRGSGVCAMQDEAQVDAHVHCAEREREGFKSS